MAPIDEILVQVGQIGLWLQAIGIVIILMIVFNVISFISNKKKLKELSAIKRNIEKLETKIDGISKKLN